jgi:hypothetical protein
MSGCSPQAEFAKGPDEANVKTPTHNSRLTRIIESDPLGGYGSRMAGNAVQKS